MNVWNNAISILHNIKICNQRKIRIENEHRCVWKENTYKYKRNLFLGIPGDLNLSGYHLCEDLLNQKDINDKFSCFPYISSGS